MNLVTAAAALVALVFAGAVFERYRHRQTNHHATVRRVHHHLNLLRFQRTGILSRVPRELTFPISVCLPDTAGRR